MALRLSALVVILSSLKLSIEALVLPRPPSTPNNELNQIINDDDKIFDEKLYNDKIVYQNSRTNVEKPNTDNYKFLEIEFSDIGKEEFRKKIINHRTNEEINLQQIIKRISRDDEYKINNAEKLQRSKKGDKIQEKDSTLKITSWEPRSYLKSIQIHDYNYPSASINDDKLKYATKSFRETTKLYRVDDVDDVAIVKSNNNNNNNGIYLKKNEENFVGEVFTSYSNNEEKNYNDYTTENILPTSSELPKQIPPPPSRVTNQIIFAHTTPVLKFMSRRTDILPNVYTV